MKTENSERKGCGYYLSKLFPQKDSYTSKELAQMFSNGEPQLANKLEQYLNDLTDGKVASGFVVKRDKDGNPNLEFNEKLKFVLKDKSDQD